MKKIVCLSMIFVLIAFAMNISVLAGSQGSSTSVEYSIDPTYIVTIPQTVLAGDNMNIGASGINTEPGMQVVVRISSGLTDGNATLIRQDAGGIPESPLAGLENVLTAPVTLGGEAVTDSTKLAIFSDTSTTNKTKGTLSVGTPDTTGKKAGTYKGTLTFNISYESINTQEPVGTATPINPNSSGEYVAMSGTDWLWFTENAASLSGKTLKLGKDLDMSLYGNTVMTNLPDNIIFDGQNHSITVDISSSDELIGLFPQAGACTIKNITVEGSIVGTNSLYAGIVGLLQKSSDSNVLIDNCINKADMELDATQAIDGQCAGGIIAAMTNHSQTGSIEITNCRSEGQITASSPTTSQTYAGGIVGICIGSSSIVQNCTNTGTITTNSTGYAGGILGNMMSDLTIDSCTNTGRIYQSVTEVTSTFPIYAAAIFDKGGQLIVTNCTPDTQNGTYN